MKQPKIDRAMSYLDDALIAGAMTAGRQARPKFSMWQRAVAIAAALVLVLAGTFGIIRAVGNQGVAVVAFDVNPSIELEVNKKEEIVAVRALNADGEKVLGDMDLKHTDLDVAVNAIIGSMLQNGYLSVEQNSILVSVDSENGEMAGRLQQHIATDVTDLLNGSQIDASVITQLFSKSEALQSQAAQSGISPALATFIQKLVAGGLCNADGTPYTYEQLAELKVNEIKLIVDSKSLTVEGLTSTGIAGEGSFFGREQAIAKALQKAGVSAEDVYKLEVELDYDREHRQMVYEVEFYVRGTEYEYELDAITGEILKSETGRAEQEDDDDTPPEGSISLKEAVIAAYTHADVRIDAITDMDWEFETERDTPVYVLEFETRVCRYRYYIHVFTGEILRSEARPR